jgi:hypothetical protein
MYWNGAEFIDYDAPEQYEWVRLEALPSGMIFVTHDGILAVKSEYFLPDGTPQCILLRSGKYAHFADGNRTLVYALEIDAENVALDDCDVNLAAVMQALGAEIAWCEAHPDKAFHAEYRKGFVNGLIQARYLIAASKSQLK